MEKNMNKKDGVSALGEESNDEKKKATYIKPTCNKFESLKKLAYRGEACGGVSGGGGGS